MLPMALLTAIVRKEAQLPEHSAAFAATQLLPVIDEAMMRHLNSLPEHQYTPALCKEMLVSATPSSSSAPELPAVSPTAAPPR